MPRRIMTIVKKCISVAPIESLCAFRRLSFSHALTSNYYGYRPRKSEYNLVQRNHVKAVSEHRWIQRRPSFTSAEVEVLLQNVDVFHHGYIHAIEFSAYLFIQCHLQC